MIQVNRLLKVTVAWTSVVYVVCFGGVALIPGIRELFLQYALHSVNVGIGQNAMTLTTFIVGLIIWNVLAVLAAWLFAYLWNTIRN
ncbi:MAG: hypothetical protein UY39_C0003G0002 [Candidatus Kaiserbacteria bacterium GW2011_GWC2_49_12]|uniref:Uncharacterized protein n=4 Tax=Candidatus Kaiseribacteriota TaxID=1752734 RepID=A0A0G1YSF2_9BACT|nr:MAG: hypothetical protein UY39_C0003G0002 [Candidatus Kaiserbacteria bacterium GW2011_GWC2_49_12]KKW17957.1 MAG: hypothetical protein UY57_C0005G0007 [Candidatus Kaiserbacteria bacterium GW2011_GWB1_50_17]KKW18652.1 MAG: hypothetical protein UY59_C0001G0023 [Candidatus Kaiserbacteria bacterium GW2011_GWA1_50_28]OGG87422.1 MAG: hypothetical protein A3H15_02880 [Candidatus Kaiserbacteria bacterium RIFCSPLOWO2_12_FULL_50_28]